MKVAVYYNLNAKKTGKPVWSIAEVKGNRGRGKLLGHADQITLANVTMVVQEGGRQAVIRDKCRSVHAWCIGEWIQERDLPLKQYAEELRYNPYRCGTFTVALGRPIERAEYVNFTKHGAIAIARI